MVVCPDPTTPEGKCVRCGATEAAAWYGKKGAKYCKTHYDADLKAKRKATGSPGTSASGSKRPWGVDAEPCPLTVDAFGEAASVVEIFSIVDERCVSCRSHPSTIARPSLSPQPARADHFRLCASAARRPQSVQRGAAGAVGAAQRRPPTRAPMLDHQFLVHCEVQENEKDEEGEKTLLWLNVSEIFGVRGVDRDKFDGMFETFEEARQQRRNDALSGFED